MSYLPVNQVNTQSLSHGTANRVAKNTLLLYFRQIITMLVSFYTVRVVLQALGASDYGIYNIVGGVVVLFSFINTAMASSTQRFINYALGKKDNEEARKAYSMSLLAHCSIAGLVLILAETVGLWFVWHKLNIPEERFEAALWVYQFSVLTTLFGIFRVPYHAVIIAHEKMKFFAQLSIIEVILKLMTAFLIMYTSFDKLIFYAFLIMFISFLMLLIYKIYCNVKYQSARFKIYYDKNFFYNLISFSGWTLFGSIANICNSQGINILLNLFYGVTANAAMGIANLVYGAVYSFVSNFQTAFNPQIVKTYAAGEKKRFFTIIKTTSKFSFFLLSFFVIPLLLNTEFVLNLWLKNVPLYTVSFVQLILICSLIDSFNAPLWMAVQASGKIRNYQIVISVLIFLNLPVSYVILKLGASPAGVLFVRVIMSGVITLWRLIYLIKYLSFSKHEFTEIITRVIIILAPIFLLLSFLKFRFSGFALFIITVCLSESLLIIFILIIGLSKGERKLLKSIFKSIIRKGV